jgi:hypothetical protein
VCTNTLYRTLHCHSAQAGREHYHQAGWWTSIGYLDSPSSGSSGTCRDNPKIGPECFIPGPHVFTHDPLPQFHSMS